MALSNSIILFFIFFLSAAHARTILPEFITKQDISNLRFVSHDGKFTYYQRRSGALLVSTNYSVKKILQGKINSNYLVSSTPTRKSLLIVQDESFHSFLSLRKLTKIYTADFDGQNIVLLGEGVNPRLHLSDSKVSYYDPYKKLSPSKVVALTAATSLSRSWPGATHIFDPMLSCKTSTLFSIRI